MTRPELLTSDLHVTFPFADDAGVPDSVASAFADASVSVPPGKASCEAVVTEVRRVPVSDGSELRVSVSVSTGGGGPSRDVVASAPLGRTGSPGFVVASSDDGSARFVVDAETALGLPPLSSGRWPLSVSCVVPETEGVGSISLMNSLDGGFPVVTDSGISGDVRLLPGFNMRIAAYDGGRIVLSAVPGEGLGRVKCDCDRSSWETDADGVPVEPPRSTGNVVPDDSGNVTIYTEGGCVAATSDGGPSLVLDGRCTACCTTRMYASAAGRLKLRNDALVRVHDRIMDAYRRYVEKVKSENARVAGMRDGAECVVGSISLTPSMSRVKGYIGGSGRYRYTGYLVCTWTVVICNMSQGRARVSRVEASNVAYPSRYGGAGFSLSLRGGSSTVFDAGMRQKPHQSLHSVTLGPGESWVASSSMAYYTLSKYPPTFRRFTSMSRYRVSVGGSSKDLVLRAETFSSSNGQGEA